MKHFSTSSDIPLGSSVQPQTSIFESKQLQTMTPIDEFGYIDTFTTLFGKIGLIFRGFKFNKRTENIDSIDWICQRRRGCKASLSTSMGPPFIYKSHKHSHKCGIPQSNSGFLQLYIFIRQQLLICICV